MPNERTWFSVDNTHILMEKQFIGELPEWHPIGMCILRQVYAAVPATWYAWRLQREGVGDDLIGRGYGSDMKAREALLESLGT